IQTCGKTMFRGCAGDTFCRRDCLHEPTELTLAKPSDLPAAPANDTFEGVVGHDLIADPQGLDRHVHDPGGLRTGTAFDDLLDQGASGLARLMLPVIMPAAHHQAVLRPDDLRSDFEAVSM